MKTLYFKREPDVRIAYTNEEETNEQEIIDRLALDNWTKITLTQFNNLQSSQNTQIENAVSDLQDNIAGQREIKKQNLIDAGFTDTQAEAILNI